MAPPPITMLASTCRPESTQPTHHPFAEPGKPPPDAAKVLAVVLRQHPPPLRSPRQTGRNVPGRAGQASRNLAHKLARLGHTRRPSGHRLPHRRDAAGEPTTRHRPKLILPWSQHDHRHATGFAQRCLQAGPRAAGDFVNPMALKSYQRRYGVTDHPGCISGMTGRPGHIKADLASCQIERFAFLKAYRG